MTCVREIEKLLAEQGNLLAPDDHEQTGLFSSPQCQLLRTKRVFAGFKQVFYAYLLDWPGPRQEVF